MGRSGGGTRCGASVTAYSLFFKNLVLRNSPEMRAPFIFFIIFWHFFPPFFFVAATFFPVSSLPRFRIVLANMDVVSLNTVSAPPPPPSHFY